MNDDVSGNELHHRFPPNQNVYAHVADTNFSIHADFWGVEICTCTRTFSLESILCLFPHDSAFLWLSKGCGEYTDL